MIKKFAESLFLVLACVGLSRAATTTVSDTGAVVISTAGWHAKGEAIRLNARPGETVKWSYSGTAAKGTLLRQWSKDATNWTTINSTRTLQNIGTRNGIEQVDDYGADPTYFRLYVSSYTSGSWTLSLADIDDEFERRLNRKRLAVVIYNDDSVAFMGPFVPYPRTLAQINALIPGTTGQFVACSDCARSAMCVSSGSVNAGSWVITVGTGVFAGSTYSGFQHCQ